MKIALKSVCSAWLTLRSLIYVPSPETDRAVTGPVRWKPLLPSISKFDTRVFEFRLQHKSFSQQLEGSKHLLPEIYTVHLDKVIKDLQHYSRDLANSANFCVQTSYRPIIFICDGLGGLLVKEVRMVYSFLRELF